MKDHNGKDAFVHIGGTAYVSVAHVATTLTGAELKRYGYELRGKHRDSGRVHSWVIRPDGRMEMEARSTCGLSYSMSADTPRVEAFLSAPKIDTSNAAIALEQISRVISGNKLAKSLKEITTEQTENIRKAVQEAIEKESRKGGLLWNAGVTNATFQGSQGARAVKSLDDLAREIYNDRRAQMIVESVDTRWRESYRLANLRLSLRAQYKAT